MPHRIRQNEPSPLSGVLMTEREAKDLAQIQESLSVKYLHENYNLFGMTAELAAVAVPSDLKPIKAVERQLAKAAVDERHEEGLWGEMTFRVGDIVDDYSYFDCYKSPAERFNRARGVIISYPNNPDKGGSWYRGKWTTQTRWTFEFIRYGANSTREQCEKFGQPVPAITELQHQLGHAWESAVRELVDTLTRRLAGETETDSQLTLAFA